MRKLLSYLWLPITASVVVILLYGSLNIVSLRIKNQNLEQKQNELRTKITQLEKEFDSLKTIQVAGVKDEQSKTKKTIPTAEPSTTPTPQPTPAPTVAATAIPTVRATSTPTPSTTLPRQTSGQVGASPTPTPVVDQATVTIENVGSYSVNLQESDTAFSILLRAGDENGFDVSYQIYEGLGAFVTCIAGICAHDNFYWAFYYNGGYSMIGASAQSVISGDTTAWKFESF